MRDRRERCFEKIDFSNLKNTPESNLIQSEAPLFCCKAVNSKLFQDAFDDSCAYILTCPFLESFKGTLFSMNDHVLKAFVTNAIMAQMSAGTGTVRSHGI